MERNDIYFSDGAEVVGFEDAVALFFQIPLSEFFAGVAGFFFRHLGRFHETHLTYRSEAAPVNG